MTKSQETAESLVKTAYHGSVLTIELNRPHPLNSLNLEMVRKIRNALEEARTADECGCVLLLGAGDRAFCAGGDVKALGQWVSEGRFSAAERFFKEEYALDLCIHHYPKPVVVVADGITMGGGLGLAAGADLIIATERTRMAMPETNIGFFPDVGATGWLFSRCPPGYPEYIGLTGYDMRGAETVRCGLSTHLIDSASVGSILYALRTQPRPLPENRTRSALAIRSVFDRQCKKDIPVRPDLDAWVRENFDDKASLQEIFHALKNQRSKPDRCRDTLKRLTQRSPTSLVITFALFKLNRGRPLATVFETELRAARLMIRHHDYLEGVRARVIDKDNQPRWRPGTVEDVQDVIAALT